MGYLTVPRSEELYSGSDILVLVAVLLNSGISRRSPVDIRALNDSNIGIVRLGTNWSLGVLGVGVSQIHGVTDAEIAGAVVV